MERNFLFVNRTQESSTEIINSEIKQTLEYSDKETLLKMIEALMDNNAALRKYIEILEKE